MGGVRATGRAVWALTRKLKYIMDNQTNINDFRLNIVISPIIWRKDKENRKEKKLKIKV
jgi:hypothetical protein